MILSMLPLVACDPGYDIRGEVIVEDPASLGKPLLVQVFEEGQLDAHGLPVALGGRTARIALASVARSPRHTFTWGNLGCTDSTFVTAWVDLDGSANLDSLLATRSFTDRDEHDLPRNDPNLTTLRSARPAAGDRVAVSPRLRFAASGISCDPAVADVTLRLAAFQ